MTDSIRSKRSDRQWTPVLGLSDSPASAETPRTTAIPSTIFAQPESSELIELTVIIPARNEADCLSLCLQSLAAQSDDFFTLGKDWELIVVDDHSTDTTAQIARSFPGVTVVEARELPSGWTGKANAIYTAAQNARGRWLLFTDADTVHEPGNLHRAIHEAQRHKASMLSYSPRQIVSGLAQRSLMPLIFSELASAYPPQKVCNPAERIAAANGQFLLIEREAYRKLGGHVSVASKVLEDVELALLAKRRKIGLWFRYADDAVSSRMYRSTSAMLEGWTKNLALLFDNALSLALMRLLDILLLALFPILIVILWQSQIWVHSMTWFGAGIAMAFVWARTLFRFYKRVASSNFPFADCLISPLGLPLFVWLLYRSWFLHKVAKKVTWKGRSYTG